MSKEKDVFCEDCGNFCIAEETRSAKEKVWCEIPDGMKSWRKRAEVTIGKPEIKNQNNDCGDYRRAKK